MTYVLDGNIFENQISKEEVLEILMSKSVIGLDIETSRKYPKNQYVSSVYKPGLDPYLSKVIMLQIGDKDHLFVIDTRKVDPSFLKPVLESKKIVKVGHYLTFEYKHIKHNYNIELENTYDTMLVEIIQTNGLNLSYSLEALSSRHLKTKSLDGVDLFTLPKYNQDQEYLEYVVDDWARTYLDKSTRLGFINIEDRPFTTKQIEYGADDILIPLAIREKQMAKKYYPKQLVALECEFSRVLGDIELRGMYFDPVIWKEIYEKNLKKYIEHREWLDNYVIENVPKFTKGFDLFSNENTCSIDWTSPAQVVKLFKHLGFCPKEKSRSTGKIEYTVSANIMKRVKSEEYQELIDNYLEFKELQLRVTTFGVDFFKYIHPITKRIHSSYRQILNTGRISSSSPNLQNIPKGEHRKAFTAPKGWNIINADYNAQETVVLANLSGDEQMCNMLNEGHDPHCFVATRVYRVKNKDPHLTITKESAGKGDLEDKDPAYNEEHARMRQDAKTIGFGIPYGKSAYSLRFDLNTDTEEAQDQIDLYYQTFPTLKPYFEQGHKEAFKTGEILIDKLTKRKFFFAYFHKMNSAKEAALELYPQGYEKMSASQKEEVKQSIKDKTSPLWSIHYSLKGELERRSQNYPIQGTSGSITKLAAILIRRKTRGRDDFYMTNLVHDEINSEAILAYSRYFADIVEESMIEAGAYWCKLVPLKAKAAIVDYWKH